MKMCKKLAAVKELELGLEWEPNKFLEIVKLLTHFHQEDFFVRLHSSKK
jgi:hypothetical protein